MKAMLVIDIGNDDIDSYEVCVRKTNRDTEIEWEKDAELKPLPTKIITATLSEREQERTELFTEMALLKTYADGWNDCLKKIEE